MQGMKTIKFPEKNERQVDSISLQKKTAHEKIDTLVQENAEILFRASNCFPFDFFPDQIIISREKVDIIYYSFFLTRRFVTVLIDGIYDVNVNTSIFFSSLDIRSNSLVDDVDPISFLKTKDAKIARRIILGLVMAKKQNIDVSVLNTNELKEKMIEVGKSREL